MNEQKEKMRSGRMSENEGSTRKRSEVNVRMSDKTTQSSTAESEQRRKSSLRSQRRPGREKTVMSSDDVVKTNATAADEH
ncbi:hypothetical protein KIN20_036772 [Parelaphostrongylus tenuis]|uniref:Uncharacterized protein n=1 Tax=Parelaphostrongylus tenuis TaxID=148309 RepID=A0AAD5WLJ0_PARTN|nr:hypothetical protein KIN20_036772 [Parelaphostrongylus tenuis]